MNADNPLVITPKFSWSLVILLCGFSLLISIGILLCQFSLLSQCLLIIFVWAVVSVYLQAYRGSRMPHRIITASRLEKNIWYLRFANGNTCIAELAPHNFVSLFCIVLRFRLPERRRIISLPLFFDSAPAASLRRLRMLLLSVGHQD